MFHHQYPVLYEVQTRATLHILSEELKRKATLDDIPDKMLDEWKENGFDWIWLLGIWKTGKAGREMSASKEHWMKEYKEALPDLKKEDIIGSCFAIREYTVHEDFGGERSLSDFRKRLHAKGMKLMLDFVPNHTALDHAWVKEEPDYFIRGRKEEMEAEPDNYIKLKSGSREIIFAHGRDPNFPGWPDTLQLDYSNPDLQRAMKEELISIAKRCDGLRCDMAMLLLPDVFEKTWRRPVRPFWAGAIERVRDEYPNFLFLAEVYWDREWEMQQLGFDYCYDKRLYDRLLNPYAPVIRDHLHADLVYQNRLARFLENHDEMRAAKVFPEGMHQAAAIITYFTPGMKFFHQGQLEGYLKKIPVHLGRGPNEKPNKAIQAMYGRILDLLKEPIFKLGYWKMLECRRSWEEDETNRHFLAFCWQHPDYQRHLITVNYSPEQAKCYVAMPFPELAGSTWRLSDRLGDEVYDRDGSQMLSEGLYLDVQPWSVHLFKVNQL